LIGFIVPIKPKSFSKDWDYDTKLLSRTAQSICAQLNKQFKLIIVYNEKPDITFTHHNIIFVQYPFAPVLIDEIEDFDTLVSKYYSRTYAERMMDKGKKITYGCKIAMEMGCEYLMAIDSDDLISNKIAGFVEESKAAKPAGWRIQKGYIYEEDAHLLIKKKDIQNINGSTHIIRKDLITIPDFSINAFWNYSLFEAHGYTYYRIKDYHHEMLQECPFFGTIYIVHKANYSNILHLSTKKTIKNLLKKILYGKLITNKIRLEFNLYKL
jgi:hypothetical protein